MSELLALVSTTLFFALLGAIGSTLIICLIAYNETISDVDSDQCRY
jgi:hypothetical protein